MNFIKENRYFLILFLLFLYIGGTLLFFESQGDAIFFFSDKRTVFGDLFFTYFTKVGEEGMYFVVIACLLYFIKPLNYRFIAYIALLGGTVTLISYFLKTYFRHPRPSLYFERNGILDEIIRVADVALNGGLNSFPSGHTMSGFALYAFVAFVIPNKKWGGILLFLVAFLVGLSRIYLVQHFLQDVYIGAIIGVGIGVLWWWIKERLERKKNP